MTEYTMRNLKHNKAGYFIWSYYPLWKHKRELVEEFMHKVFSIRWLVSEERVNSYLKTGYINISKHLEPTETEYEVYLTINGISYAGLPDQSFSFAPQLYREGMVSMTLSDYNGYLKYYGPRAEELFFELIGKYIETFRPVYGFGHVQFNKWCNDHDTWPPPETRIWPYNLFNLEAYPPELRGRLVDFHEENGEEWELRFIGDEMAELRKPDTMVKVKDVKPKVTQAILGEGDELLTPNVGYPPPERWWD
jgi:hypothetical protein